MNTKENEHAFWKNQEIITNTSQMVWKIRFSQLALNIMTSRYLSGRESFITVVMKMMLEFSLGGIFNDSNCQFIGEGPCAGMTFFRV